MCMADLPERLRKQAGEEKKCFGKPSSRRYNKIPKEVEDYIESFGYKHVGNSFDISGIRIGLEICADHMNRVLEKEKKPVQLHLIISAGMFIVYSAVQGKEGPVFLQDGSNPQMASEI